MKNANKKVNIQLEKVTNFQVNEVFYNENLKKFYSILNTYYYVRSLFKIISLM